MTWTTIQAATSGMQAAQDGLFRTGLLMNETAEQLDKDLKEWQRQQRIAWLAAAPQLLSNTARPGLCAPGDHESEEVYESLLVMSPLAGSTVKMYACALRSLI